MSLLSYMISQHGIAWPWDGIDTDTLGFFPSHSCHNYRSMYCTCNIYVAAMLALL